MSDPITFETSLRGDADDEVRSLFRAAESRKEAELRYHLIDEALRGEVIDVTKSKVLFEALNKEKMEFDELLRLHPEEVKADIEHIKSVREQSKGVWYNPNSKAKHGYLGRIPDCCYFARPDKYWRNKKLLYNFFNTYPVFRVSERPI